MSEKKPDFFDEIVAGLRACENDSPAAYVPKETLLEFYRPVQRTLPRTAPGTVLNRSGEPLAAGGAVARSIREAVRGNGGISRSPSNAEQGTEQPAAQPAGTEQPDALQRDIGAMDWEEIRNAVAICTRCLLCRSRTNTVFGDGNASAGLMFIGEGPGAEEDAQGLPFVGRAGELLTRMILAMGFRREEVFIGNIVKCRPPGNRTPEDSEIASCLPFIRRQIELVAPKAIVLLGATPLKGLFGLTGITRRRGTFLDYEGIPAMPTFHPAYLLRNPGAKGDVWKDLQLVMKLFGKTPGAKGR